MYDDAWKPYVSAAKRRQKAAREAAKVREIYEELVLNKKPDTLVQIGSIGGVPTVTSIGSAPVEKAEKEELVQVQ